MVVGLIVAAAGLAGIHGHQTSDANNERDRSLQEDAESTWSGDRQFIQNEVNLLSSEYNNPAPPAITNPEAFDTWSHQEIWDALNVTGTPSGGVQQADINAGADGWRRLTAQAGEAIGVFRSGITDDINRLWSGRAANSAMTASQSYATEFETLKVSFQQVANGIDLMQGYLDQAKLSVPPPEETDAVDRFLSHIPGNGVLKLGQHRANEAEARAQDVMKSYQVGATEVDTQTPLLPEPKSPVNSSTPDQGSTPWPPISRPPGTGGDPETPGSQDPSNTGDPNSPGDDPSTEDPSTGDPTSTEDPSSTENPWSTADPNTDPASTNPASTVPSSNPAGLTDPSNRPSLGSPGSGSPGSGSPGSGSPGSTPSPGASIPGSGAAAQPTGAGAANARTGAGANSRAGMPGMGMGGGRGAGGKDDESEHGIPDYLVQDRTTELLGEQPRVLPPGGVIGG